MSTTQTAPAIVRKATTGTILKADANGPQGLVSAVVNVTNIIDSDGDRLVPGAFAKQISAGKLPKVVASHDWSKVVGKVVELKEMLPGDPELPDSLRSAGAGALVANLKFNLDTEAGRTEFSNLAGGFTDEFSIGFLPEAKEFNAESQCLDIKSAFPVIEVSTVLMGASRSQDGSLTTGTLAVKSVKLTAEEQQDEAERYLRSVERVKEAERLDAAARAAITVLAQASDEDRKAMALPDPQSDEARHAGPLNDALTAIKALIVQEAAEPGVEMDGLNWLSSIGSSLVKWARNEPAEAITAEPAQPTPDIDEKGAEPAAQPAAARPLYALLEATLPAHISSLDGASGDEPHVLANHADSLLSRLGRPYFGRP